MKNLSKRKKITIASVVSILLITLVVIIAVKINQKANAPQEEVVTKVDIQDDNASLNDVVLALDGEVIADEDDVDTTTFQAEDQEVIVSVGSNVAIVNGEEKLLRDVVKVEIDAVEDKSTEAAIEEAEESKQEGAYVYKEEVFVPIEFIEGVFDLEFNDETLEFTRDDEVIIGGEVIENPKVDAVEEDESIDLETEEVETDDVDVKEDIIEEDAAEKPQEAPETTEKPANSNNTTQTGTKPQTPQNSSNSASDSQSSNSSNSGSSNAGSNNSAPEPKPQEPVTPPAPQPVKVTSITTDKVSLTLEVGQTGKMTANVQPSNADNKGVTFVSSNTSVATVDGNGNITAKGAGSALITAKSNENGNISVSIGVTVNEKPKPQPTYTGNSIVNRAVNELGWCKRSDKQAFLGPYGCQTGIDMETAQITAQNGNNGWDVTIGIYDSSAPGVVSGVESIIRWMMPSQGQQLINKLHDPNYYGGTHTLDGRSVTVTLKSYGISITIGPKY